MSEFPKYRAPQSVEIENRVWPTRRIKTAPVMVPVDLRDGNQAFVRPMNVETKTRYFNMLCGIGYKEIEVAYPAASSEEFEFVRRLIGDGIVPDDVRINVFTAARKDLIDRTVGSIAGAKRAAMHCYIATSELHRRFVFGKEPDEIIRIAVEGTRMIADAIGEAGMRDRVVYEFSPEEFTDSDVGFIVELGERVRAAWNPRGKGDFILNLPSTVERRPPYEYADMIESFVRRYSGMADTTISVHAHNDQGCAVAAAEMAVLAGAERVEGTLAGHGERTGNMDLITFALNFMSRGIDPGLDFSRLPEITAFIEEASGISTNPRTPYAGELVFTAFSGTHQDAIRKGMARRGEISEQFRQGWKMPYIHLDPVDIGRNYDGLVRINSQSGKGGVAYVLESVYGIPVPKGMQPSVAKAVQAEAEATGDELTPSEVCRIFREKIVEAPGRIAVGGFRLRRPAPGAPDKTEVRFEIEIGGRRFEVAGTGGGPIEAAAEAFQRCPACPAFQIEEYSEHAIGRGAAAEAVAFLGIRPAGAEHVVYGAGIDGNVNLAAIRAIANALNHIVAS